MRIAQKSSKNKLVQILLDVFDSKLIASSIFGSRAKADYHGDSDLDLLVIADGLSNSRVERIPTIVKLKERCNFSFPVDAILTTRSECVANFKNHNPLYLDIAYDGIIIYDTNRFLTNQIEETLDYIKAKKIRRLEDGDGWRFPIDGRKPTFLSKITNKEHALAWMEDGERDLIAAKKLMDSKLYEKSVYHSQQTVEKAVKSVLICWGIHKRSHFVANLLEGEILERSLIRMQIDELNKVVKIAKELEPHVSLSRYPEIKDTGLWQPQKEYDKNIAIDIYKKAELAMQICRKFVEDWFEPRENSENRKDKKSGSCLN